MYKCLCFLKLPCSRVLWGSFPYNLTQLACNYLCAMVSWRLIPQLTYWRNACSFGDMTGLFSCGGDLQYCQ